MANNKAENRVKFLSVVKDHFQLDDDISLDLMDKFSLDNIPYNSITFIRLIVKLEEEFEIEIDGRYLDFQRYETLEAIFLIVEESMSKP